MGEPAWIFCSGSTAGAAPGGQSAVIAVREIDGESALRCPVLNSYNKNRSSQGTAKSSCCFRKEYGGSMYNKNETVLSADGSRNDAGLHCHSKALQQVRKIAFSDPSTSGRQ